MKLEDVVAVALVPAWVASAAGAAAWATLLEVHRILTRRTSA